MSSFYKVCCIMDVGGFDVRVSDNGKSYRNKFLVRELGYIQIDPKLEYQPMSFRFDLRKEIDMQKLPPDVHRTLRFQSQKLIGLSVLPTQKEMTKEYGELEGIVREMYETCQQPGRDVVAYKGGTREKEILDSLKIPSLDLGLCGCKTYANLVKERLIYSSLKSCGNHIGARNPVQCSMAEVTAYRDWYMRNCKPDDEKISEDDSDDDEW